MPNVDSIELTCRDPADRPIEGGPMQVPRPSDADRQRFRDLVPERPDVAIKPMFGNLGAFVNGNMFMGLFGSEIGVKLPPDELARVRGAGGGPFGPAERPMGGYVSLPASAEPTQ